MHLDVKEEPELKGYFDIEFYQNKLMKEDIMEDNFLLKEYPLETQDHKKTGG